MNGIHAPALNHQACSGLRRGLGLLRLGAHLLALHRLAGLAGERGALHAYTLPGCPGSLLPVHGLLWLVAWGHLLFPQTAQVNMRLPISIPRTSPATSFSWSRVSAQLLHWQFIL